MDRFVCLPKTIKDQIYGELYGILNSNSKDHAFGEQAFHSASGLSSNGDQKALAIECYLAMQQFRSLPQEERTQVYQELYHVIGHCENDYWGCAEDAFHNLNGQRSMPQKRLQAIKNYFAKRDQSAP